MRVLIVSPHRDDAAFSLSLTIDAWLSRGLSIEVMNCFTQSVYAPFVSLPNLTLEQRMATVTAMRKAEDQLWREDFAPPFSIVDLDLLDAPLRLGCTDSEVCSWPAPLADKTSRTISRAVSDFAPDVVVVPFAMGNHVDHRVARDAAIFGRIVESIIFYEDLPYCTRPGVDSEIAVAARTQSVEEVFAGPEVDPIVAGKSKRLRAGFYASQIDSATLCSIASFAARYGGRERLWCHGRLLEHGHPLVLAEDSHQ